MTGESKMMSQSNAVQDDEKIVPAKARTSISFSSASRDPHRTPLGHLHAHAVTMQQAIERIVERVHLGTGGFVVTPNIDHICIAENSPELRTAYRGSFLSIPDGQPLIWIAKLLGHPLPERVSGSDLVWPLLERAATEGFSVFFLGSTEDVCTKLVRKLDREIPTLRVAGWASPAFSLDGDPTDMDMAVAKVKASRPDLVFVALGNPKQEVVMWRYEEEFAPAVALGIGAALDFVVGDVRRAPKWMSDSGLEWAYRLAVEPGRLWRRYLVRDRAIARIVWRTYRQVRTERATLGD